MWLGDNDNLYVVVSELRSIMPMPVLDYRKMGREIAKKTNNGEMLSGSEFRVFQDGFHELITTEKRALWFESIYGRVTGKKVGER